MANETGNQEVNGNTGIARDQTTHEFVTGLKEREDLKAKLHDKEREVNTLKGQNYDLMKKLESLEKQLAEVTQDEKKRRPSNARKPKRPAARRKGISNGKEKTQKKLSPESANKEVNDPFEDPEKLYADIAVKFPDIPLSTVLRAEKKFVEADVNRDGTIDSDELETLLDSSSTSGTALFTKDQVKEIMKKIDLDNTNSIDFMECLGLLDLMRQNRKTGLSMTMQQNVKSAVCSIQ